MCSCAPTARRVIQTFARRTRQSGDAESRQEVAYCPADACRLCGSMLIQACVRRSTRQPVIRSASLDLPVRHRAETWFPSPSIPPAAVLLGLAGLGTAVALLLRPEQRDPAMVIWTASAEMADRFE